MSGTAHREKTAFEKAYSEFTLPKIDTIEQVELPGDAPGFIHQKKVNGQNLFFLGEDFQDHKKLKDHYYRVDKMVIPEYARMVNASTLRALLEKSDNDDSIDVSGDDFFLAGKLNSSVMLDVVGLLTPFTYQDMHFHHCDNHDPEKKQKLEDRSDDMDENFKSLVPIKQAWGKGQCFKASTTHSFDQEGNLQEHLVLFYISIEDMEVSWRDYSRNDPPAKIYTPQKMLSLYFTDNHYHISDSHDNDNPKISNWDELKGVFLLPGVGPDERVIYQCLLNIKGKSNTNRPLKKSLKQWFRHIDAVNTYREEDALLEIAGNDYTNMWIEPWSVYIAKNFEPITIPARDLYKDGIVENRLP